MNQRADRFSTKKSMQKQAIMNSQTASQGVTAIQSMMVKVFEKLAGFQGRIDGFERVQQVTEWRLMAAVNLLKELVPDFTEAKLNLATEVVQIEDFNQQSAADDKEQNLIIADDEAAQEGYHAIFTADTFDSEGVEMPTQRQVRCKIQLGNQDTFAEVEEALIGLKVNEQVSLTFDYKGVELTAGITLLGLRKKALSKVGSLQDDVAIKAPGIPEGTTIGSN